MKFLTTSRPYDDIQIHFRPLIESSSQLHLRREDEDVHIYKEINIVVRVKVTQFATILNLPSDRIVLWKNAAIGGHVDVVQKSLENGPDVNTQREKFENGADVNGQDAENAPYLAAGGHVQITQQLLVKGVDFNAQSEYYGTPLHAAIEEHIVAVQKLIENGADINASCEDYGTVL
ncbi:hypothetical protein ZTR_09348 [Talaromyces verruculosus]|nr:hypothetical protein ZTR_09348 [Talaromyces verruculosus]